MFTGIIEEVGQVKRIESASGNLILTVSCSFVNELKIDQSVAHNGVCLTVTDIAKNNNEYKVTVVEETLQKTNLGKLSAHDSINLERCLKADARIDGHFVQGHVDITAKCISITHKEGSRNFTFSHDKNPFRTIEKGSVALNGVSLTTFHASPTEFTVTIIPYTLENTTFKTIKEGDFVNVEFDVLGKYITSLVSAPS